MNQRKKIQFEIQAMWFDFRSFAIRTRRKTRRQIWNKGILLWWYKLWIRKNEFHQSLNMDTDAMLAMTDEQRFAYIADLTKKRNIAHQRDLATC